MVKKKKYKSNGITEQELEELKAHNKDIDEKEKLLKIKHQKLWEKKKKRLKKYGDS